MKFGLFLSGILLFALAGCVSSGGRNLQACVQPNGVAPDYVIGAGDTLDIFVWLNPELSTNIPVRPDGRISMPLVEDMVAVGKPPSVLARDIEGVLSQYIREPTVNIIVRTTGGASGVQVVGSVGTPQSVPYREGIRVLDAIVSAGGLSEFAAGNRATIVRTLDQSTVECRVRLSSLINDGDISQNIQLRPGDVVIVPESNF
jgi:polysaccharide export outer membrane protein